MNNTPSKNIIGLTVLITCVAQGGILDDPLKSKEAVKGLSELAHELPDIGAETVSRMVDVIVERAKEGAKWGAITASVGVAGYYTYRWAFPSPEERARRAGVGLIDCFKKNIDGRRSKHGIPSACVDQAFAYGLAREALDNRERWPRTQEFIDDFKHYTASTESS